MKDERKCLQLPVAESLSDLGGLFSVLEDGTPQVLDLVVNRSVLLEDYARRMIAEEELHIGEVNKMLRKPGDITQFVA